MSYNYNNKVLPPYDVLAAHTNRNQIKPKEKNLIIKTYARFNGVDDTSCRRFSTSNTNSVYESLIEFLKTAYSQHFLSATLGAITYFDDDGDECIISTVEEMDEAIRLAVNQLGNSVLKLHINFASTSNSRPSSIFSSNGSQQSSSVDGSVLSHNNNSDEMGVNGSNVDVTSVSSPLQQCGTVENSESINPGSDSDSDWMKVDDVSSVKAIDVPPSVASSENDSSAVAHSAITEKQSVVVEDVADDDNSIENQLENLNLEKASSSLSPPLSHAQSDPWLASAVSGEDVHNTPIQNQFSPKNNGFALPQSIPIPSVSTEVVYDWQWQNDTGEWYEFSQFNSYTLSKAKEMGKMVVPLIIQGRRYVVDLEHNYQVNAHTGTQRVIRRHPLFQGESVHSGVRCDICLMNPIIGTRYKCSDENCDNFDMCSSCEATSTHAPSHTLIKIRSPLSHDENVDLVNRIGSRGISYDTFHRMSKRKWKKFANNGCLYYSRQQPLTAVNGDISVSDNKTLKSLISEMNIPDRTGRASFRLQETDGSYFGPRVWLDFETKNSASVDSSSNPSVSIPIHDMADSTVFERKYSEDVPVKSNSVPIPVVSAVLNNVRPSITATEKPISNVAVSAPATSTSVSIVPVITPARVLAAPVPVALISVSPTPVAPTPVAPTPVAPTPVAPTPVVPISPPSVLLPSPEIRNPFTVNNPVVKAPVAVRSTPVANPHAIAINGYPVDPSFGYYREIAFLESMGFRDYPLMSYLLTRYNGEMERVLNNLLSPS